MDSGTTLQGGILGGWAFAGTDWLTHSGGTLAAYTGYTTLTGVNPVLPNSASANVTFGATSSGTVGAGAGTTDINTLRVTDTATRVVDLGVGNTLRLGAVGGVWRALSSGTTDSLTISNGTLTAGGAANTPGEVILVAGGTGGDSAAHANVGIRLYSVITDNGTGAVALTKLGPQTVRLNGANTCSGDTFVLQGRLISAVAGSLGGSVHVMQDLNSDHGSVQLAGAGDYTNAFFLAGPGPNITYSPGLHYSHGALTFGHSSARVTGQITLVANTRIGSESGVAGTVTGRITGNAALEFYAESWPSSGSVKLTNPANDWSGRTTLGMSGTSGHTRILYIGASEVIPNGAGKGDVFLANSSSQTGALVAMDLGGFSETINGLSSSGGNVVGSRVVRNSASAAATATLTLGDNDANGTFFGTIQNGHASALLAVRKIGAGKQVFSGNCTHTGGTTVDGGTLEVSGSLTGGTVKVNEGATFVYTGSSALARAVTIDGGTFVHSTTNGSGYTGVLTFTAGGIGGTNWLGNLSGLTIDTGRWIAPGASVGKAVVGDQSWSNGGTYEFEITDAAGFAGTGWDTVAGTGSLDLSGLTAAGGFAVAVTGLDATGAAGLCQNFDPGTAYVWPIATFASIVYASNSANIAVDAAAFANEVEGSFRVVVLDATTLALQYNPNNGTLILVR